jgi:hypothetical protein
MALAALCLYSPIGSTLPARTEEDSLEPDETTALTILELP